MSTNLTTELNLELQLSNSARIWVYQSDRKFTTKETEIIEKTLKVFVDSWQSHGNKLKAHYKIVYDQFIILGVDESVSGASGCSIDSSVHIIKELEEKLNINLLDKSQVAYFKDEVINTIDFRKIKDAIQSGDISSSTLIFNNQINSYQELKTNWLIEARDSWLVRFF